MTTRTYMASAARGAAIMQGYAAPVRERDALGRYVQALAGFPRDASGMLPAYAWPGGYPIVYYTVDGLTICPRCASDADTSDPVTAGDIYWEGPAMPCDDGSKCGAMDGGSWRAGMIESAYGDPEAPEHA